MTTTADEVWQLLRELIESQKETDRGIKELRDAQKETDREIKALREAQQETFRENDREIKALRDAQKETDRQIKASQQENDREIKELRKSQQETDRGIRELRESQQETDREIKELGKQIGGLGKKFGSFTEGMALPSMEMLLREKFNMEVVSPSIRVRKGGKELQLDVFAYNNGDLNTAYIVEVKSHAREEAIPQLHNILERFRTFFPEHQHRTLYGILAAVDISTELREKALQAGFYVARIHNELFELDTPEIFTPKAY